MFIIKTLRKDLLFIEEGAANKLQSNYRLNQIQQIKSMVDREETKQFIYKFYWSIFYLNQFFFNFNRKCSRFLQDTSSFGRSFHIFTER